MLVASLLSATSAAARPAPSPPPRHVISVLIDVTGWSFSSPMVRPAVDLRLSRKWALEMSVGLGSATTFSADGKRAGDHLSWDAAVRPRYFLLGDFEQGFHVGGAVTFGRVTGGDLSQQELAEPPAGLSIGPTIGFQSTLFPLITLDVEVGPLFRVVTPQSAYQPSLVVPYAAFMIGRSF